MTAFDPTPDLGPVPASPRLIAWLRRRDLHAPAFGAGNLTEAPQEEPETRLPSERLPASQSDRMRAEANRHFAGGAA